ncbi:IS3 family transposase [Staphylococcus delphini]|uniref:IS3 family transposase n=1 Tax=Staphylococcus delphini TaxID=53344 RepID=A0AAQ0DAE4_9STAP|nr:IS3 family transposase [Staphylococcus delphini]QUM70604.1 IS3 family transposase [Staphylococcus delphini]
MYRFIYEHRHEFRVVEMCQVLGVSKSGYYDWKNCKPSERILKRDGLKKHIYQMYIKSQKRYGSPKITQILRYKGHTVTQRTVSRLMKELGIRSITKKNIRPQRIQSIVFLYPNLLNQQFKVSQPGSVWVADITYVYTREGWLYLATFMDLFSRRIIGWAMTPRMTKTLVMLALNKACTIEKPREGLILHSDRGSQYASIRIPKFTT